VKKSQFLKKFHNDRASRSASSRQCACPFYRCGSGFFFWSKHHNTQVCQPPTAHIWLHLTFSKAKIAVEREDICECDGHTVHKLSKRRLTAD
jgi:hypothetical protein